MQPLRVLVFDRRARGGFFVTNDTRSVMGIPTVNASMVSLLSGWRAPGWRWPRSAAQARIHVALTAAVLWTLLIVTFAAGSGARSLAGPIKGPDFLQFYASGYLVRTHQPERLYDMAALHQAQVALVPESSPELYPPVYPPQLAILFSPLSLLSYRGALLVWALVTCLTFALIVRNAWRPVSRELDDWGFVLLAAAAFPPFWSLVLHGQMTVIVLAAFWAGWRALERDRRFWAGCAFGFLLVKPQFAIPLVTIAIACREWRMVAGAAAAIAAQAALVLLVLGTSVVSAYASFVPAMLRYADLLEPKPYQSHSLRALTRLVPGWLGLALWIGAAAVLLVLTVRVWKSAAPLRVRLGVVMFVSVLANPHVIVYDAAVLVLPLMWFGAYIAERHAAHARDYWTLVYWLCVLLLAPTAAVIGVQASVLIMIGLIVFVRRRIESDHRAVALHQ